MDLQETINRAETVLRPFAVGATRFEGNRLDVVVKREDLVPAVAALRGAHWGYLAVITGLDQPWPKTPAKPGVPAAPAPAPEGHTGPLEDRLEALYHFVEGAAVATIRVTVPYSDPHVPTICGLVPTATLYERELQEMFGFVVDGTPVTDRLVLPDDWPDGVYPLRKSFTGLQAASR